jgi:hypothetical protein
MVKSRSGSTGLIPSPATFRFPRHLETLSVSLMLWASVATCRPTNTKPSMASRHRGQRACSVVRNFGRRIRGVRAVSFSGRAHSLAKENERNSIRWLQLIQVRSCSSCWILCSVETTQMPKLNPGLFEPLRRIENTCRPPGIGSDANRLAAGA